MKKRFIFIGLILIIISIIVFFMVNKNIQNRRNYNIEQITKSNYFVMKEKEKYGVIDTTGKVIIEAKYDNIVIPNPAKDVFICYSNEKAIALNMNNQHIFAEYNTVEAINLKNTVTNFPYEKSVLKTEKNGKYGLIDFDGRKILESEYDSIDGLPGIEGELQVEKNGKYGVVNIKGTILVKIEYDSVIGDNYYNEGIKHGYIVGEKIENGYNYGYVNYKGKLTAKLQYNDILRITDAPINEIYLIAAINGQYGVIRNKKLIINNEYQSIEYDKTNRVFIIQKGKKYGVANIDGTIIIPVENTNIQAKGEYIYVENNNIKEVYDVYGNKADIEFNKTIIPTKNDKYKITIDNDEKGNYYGIINNDNKQIVNSEYLYIEYAFDNFFIACGKNGKLGVIDNSGEIIIELKYDLVQKIQGKNFIQTLYSETNTTEIFSESMKKICEMQKATIENKDDYIKIHSNGEIKYINNNGDVIPSSEALPNNKIYAASKDGKWGYVDSSNKIIVNYEYDFANEINEYGYAAIKKDEKWGAIDSNGKVVIEPKYKLNENYGKIDFIGEYVKINSGLGNEYYTKDI